MPISNLFLESLPAETRASLLAVGVQVDLPRGKHLYETSESPDYAYFITSGFASVVVTTSGGGIAEVGVIGREGLVGSQHLLGPGTISTNCFVQIAGSGLRVPLDYLRSLFLDSEEFRSRTLELVQFQNMTVSQVAACNALHEAEGRLARWLLTVQDITELQTLPLTQEFLAEMLGNRRTTVAVVAGKLQAAQMIDYSRGKVRIINRTLLERTACECYPIIRRALDHLYNG